MPLFDAIRFLNDHFADSTMLRESFRRQGYEPPTFEAIRKWRQRRTYPTEWLVSILAILEADKGRPVSITPYVQENPACSRASRSKDKSNPTGAAAAIFD